MGEKGKAEKFMCPILKTEVTRAYCENPPSMKDDTGKCAMRKSCRKSLESWSK